MKIALIFPGYGSQFVGMGKELYDEHRVIQEFFEEASNCLDVNFVKLCFASSDTELARMTNAYPAIFLVSVSLMALLREIGLQPDVVAGYNQGELSAVYAANGITLPDGLYLLSKYATLYQELLDTKSYSAARIKKVSTRSIEELIQQQFTDQVHIAIHETNESMIVTGEVEPVQMFCTRCKELGAEIDELLPEIGLHSSVMAPVATQLKMYFEKVDCRPLTIPFCENINGMVLQSCEEVRDHLITSITQPIMWSRVLAIVSRYDLVIEVGPGTQLTDMIMQYYPEVKVLSINKKTDIDAVKQYMDIAASQTKDIIKE